MGGALICSSRLLWLHDRMVSPCKAHPTVKTLSWWKTLTSLSFWSSHQFLTRAVLVQINSLIETFDLFSTEAFKKALVMYLISGVTVTLDKQWESVWREASIFKKVNLNLKPLKTNKQTKTEFLLFLSENETGPYGLLSKELWAPALSEAAASCQNPGAITWGKRPQASADDLAVRGAARLTSE